MQARRALLRAGMRTRGDQRNRLTGVGLDPSREHGGRKVATVFPLMLRGPNDGARPARMSLPAESAPKFRSKIPHPQGTQTLLWAERRLERAD